MKKWTLALAFIASPATADLVLDIRDDDPGFMEAISESDMEIVKTLNFDGLGSWERERDGFTWNAILSGMQTECRTSDRNPCQWPNNDLCRDAGGNKPNNRSFGEPHVPFVVSVAGDAHTLQYASSHISLFTGELPVLSMSRGGCRELGASDWGDGPWAIVFDQPYETVCFDMRFLNTDLVRRQHFKFWRNDNGIAEKVGHHDLVGEPGEPMDRRFCWGSSVPIEAVSTWQEGPGTWWLAVHVGNFVTTECERATKKAEEICALEE